MPTPTPTPSADPPRRELVVARRGEPTGWLDLVPGDIAVTVHDKGGDDRWTAGVARPVGRVPSADVGREAHAMLTHIVDRFDSLADWTYFAQGWPFDHAPDFVARLDAPYRDTATLCYAILRPMFPPPHPDDHVASVGRFPIRYAPHPDPGPSLAAWRSIFEGPPPAPLLFGFAGMWAVPRRRIVGRPISLWRRLLAGVERAGDAIDAWTLEALWLYLFGDPARFPHRTIRP